MIMTMRKIIVHAIVGCCWSGNIVHTADDNDIGPIELSQVLGPTLLNKIARWSHHQSSNSAWKEGPHQPVGKGHLRSGYVKIAIENGPFSSLIYPLNIVIFQNYVSLPEGMYVHVCSCLFIIVISADPGRRKGERARE